MQNESLPELGPEAEMSSYARPLNISISPNSSTLFICYQNSRKVVFLSPFSCQALGSSPFSNLFPVLEQHLLQPCQPSDHGPSVPEVCITKVLLFDRVFHCFKDVYGTSDGGYFGLDKERMAISFGLVLKRRF